MDATHLHLALNHVPVIGLGFALLILSTGFVRRDGGMQKLGFITLVLIALVAFGVMQTGDAAEETAEHLPGVTEAVIEHHEEAARTAVVAVYVLGALALAGLVAFRSRPRVPGAFVVSALVATVLAAGLMARTANLGGQVRHTEIRAEGAGGGAAVVSGDLEEDED